MRDRTRTVPGIDAARGRWRASVLLLVLVSGASSSAAAADWGGMLGIGTDNLMRGHSLSDGEAAWLADLHVDFAGAWVAGIGAGSERTPGQSAGAQVTAYLDRRWRLDDRWVAKLGVVHYESPWNRFNDQLRYNEISAAIGYRGRWSATFTHSPDAPGVSSRGRPLRTRANFFETSLHQRIAGRLAADFGLGYAAYAEPDQDDYAFGSAGLRYGIGDVYLYGALVWTNPSPQVYGLRADPRRRWVASLVWTF